MKRQGPIPAGWNVLKAVPNPARAGCVFAFALTEREKVRLDLFTIKGEWIASLVNREMTSGNHAVKWAGPVSGSGVILARLRTGNSLYYQKILFIK
jgi:hypothetical protein